MKKIHYFYLFVVSLLFLQSCLKEENELFDKSAAQRLMEAQEEYEAVLKSAKNGWYMDYYAGGQEQRIGGYQILCKFDDNGKATLAGTYTLGDYNTLGEKVESGYQITRMQGPCLSFGTYNTVLHPFGDPGSMSDPNGYSGDFEFVIVSATAKEVVMRGIKQKHTIVLRPIETEQEWGEYWDEYCAEVQTIREAISDYTRFEVRKAGSIAGYLTMWSSDTQFHDTEKEKIVAMNYTINNKGIMLYDSLVVGGSTIRQLVWDTDNSIFRSANASENLEVAPVNISFAQLVGTYAVTCNNLDHPVTVRLTDNGDGTIHVSNELLLAIDETLNYGFNIAVYANNNLGIPTQTLAQLGDKRYLRLAVTSRTSIFGLIQSTGYNIVRPYAGAWYRGIPDKPELRFMTSSYVSFFSPVYLTGVRVVEFSDPTAVGSTYVLSAKTAAITGLVFVKQ